MTVEAKFDITLGIAGPFLCGATAPASWGLDATFDRNHEGKPYIDRSHVKGKLREALVEIGTDSTMIESLLGKRGEMENGRLFLSDFTLKDTTIETALSNNIAAIKITRIRMDNKRHVVDPTAMLAIENAFPPAKDKKYEWKGSAWIVADEDKVKEIQETLSLGLKWISAFGADKGVGFGRLKSVIVLSKPETIKQILLTGSYETPKTTADVLTLKIIATDPLLLGDVKIKANYQESRDYIYGSAIKGALAQAINMALGVLKPAAEPISESNGAVNNAFPMLAKHFSNIRITHAYPSSNEKRPVVIPFSAVMLGDDYFDVASLKEPPDTFEKSPIFQTDWKQFPSDFGMAEPKAFVKTRTAIDPNLRRADDGQMYTYQYVCPTDKAGNPITWIAEINLAGITDKGEQAGVQAELEKAFALLRHLGKRASRVKATVTHGKPDLAQEENALLTAGNKAMVCLQSDALMIDPDELLKDQSATNLSKLYEKFWHDISGGSLTMDHFFANQKMLGGYVRSRRQAGKPYYPYFLTTSGSVFVLTATNVESAGKKLEEWKAKGLKAPDWAKTSYGEPLWQGCPFTPENGFGEIRVNLKWHEVKKWEEKGGIKQ